MAVRPFIRIAVAGIAGLVFAIPCARAQSPTTKPSTQPARAAPPQVGERAPEFSLISIGGETISLSDSLRDGPAAVVVLRGWPGYQCPICTKQVADLRRRANDFAAEHGRVLLIYPGPTESLKAHAAEFVGPSALPDGFTLLLDPDYTFTNAWHLRWEVGGETAYPSSFVVDRTGLIRFAKVSPSHGGRASPEELLNAIKAWR